MVPGQDTWSGKIIEALKSRPELMRVYIIPMLLFLLDFVLRAVIGVDLIDAGADMALLAVASFTAVLVEDVGHTQPKASVVLPLFLIFLLPWIFCLWSVSNRTHVRFNVFGLFVEARLILSVLSWFVGVTSLTFSGALVNYLVKDSSVPHN